MKPRFFLLYIPLILIAVQCKCMSFTFGQLSDTSLFKIGKLLHKDDFSTKNEHWFTEFEIPEQSFLNINEGKLELTAKKGATVWFKEKLSGDYMISYDALLVDKGDVS